jgi:hypothetical protein
MYGGELVSQDELRHLTSEHILMCGRVLESVNTIAIQVYQSDGSHIRKVR